MNCPSRTDDPPPDAGWNQNPPNLAADLTTRQDLNGIINSRSRQSLKLIRLEEYGQVPIALEHLHDAHGSPSSANPMKASDEDQDPRGVSPSSNHRSLQTQDHDSSRARVPRGSPARTWQMLLKFGKFVGPGFMIAVAYIDPGNYSTDVAAGASKKFSLLFIVLMSNVFAIVLQSLAIRLGTVTGLNLAEHCRAHLPRWLNIVLYILGECAIIATDIAEV